MIKLPGLNPIAPADILYMAGDGPYTKVFTITGKILVSSLTLSRTELIAPTFIRIHKCWLVNPTYIMAHERTGYESAAISMQDRTVLPISRRRMKAVIHVLRQRRIDSTVEPVS